MGQWIGSLGQCDEHRGSVLSSVSGDVSSLSRGQRRVLNGGRVRGLFWGSVVQRV
jgi:hypothetical protein